MLKRGGCFRTAVSLARSLADSSSPVLKELYLGWARQAVGNGNVELAAKCFVAGGELLEASKLLSRSAEL